MVEAFPLCNQGVLCFLHNYSHPAGNFIDVLWQLLCTQPTLLEEKKTRGTTKKNQGMNRLCIKSMGKGKYCDSCVHLGNFTVDQTNICKPECLFEPLPPSPGIVFKSVFPAFFFCLRGYPHCQIALWVQATQPFLVQL